MSGYFNLGTFTREITTSSPEAQAWFTRGLVWAYGFNHEESVRCFERAIGCDPDCVLAYWGLAYALGPNYNKPWEAFDPVEKASCVSRARAALAAASRAAGASATERALVRALAARYPAAEPAGDCAAWNLAYAGAMRDVYRAYPDDLDVATLFADALMNLAPWALWDLPTGKPADAVPTLEAKQVLERALARADGRAHPGVLHLYIHLMELSARPEDALRAGDWLRELVPDAGHLRHMPTHIDVLCGGLLAGRLVQLRRDPRRQQLPGAGRGDELLHAVPGAQLPFQDLRGDVPGPGADCPGSRRPARRDDSRRPAPGRGPPRWRTGSRASCR